MIASQREPVGLRRGREFDEWDGYLEPSTRFTRGRESVARPGDVAEATRRLLVAVERALVDLHPIWEFPIPERGQVRVVALTYSGPLGAVAAEADLASGVGPLARAYAASAVVLDGISRVEAAAAAAGGPSSVGEQFE